MSRFIIAILLLAAILLGCSSQIHSEQHSNTTVPNVETTWKTVPAPNILTIYSGGKSKEIKQSNPEYPTLANQIESVLTSSSLSSAPMYQLALPPGGNFSNTSLTGVELVYNSPFLLTTKTSKPSVYRLFIRCDEKPMLFIGVKHTNDYWGSGLGPLVLNNTDSLEQLVNSMIKQD